ncbi:MAG TPA: DUF3108 domain-containing protein [bacterium]|nr:DUF3108 domain-containing protein [bacterium]
MKNKKLLLILSAIIGVLGITAAVLWQYNTEQTKVEPPQLADNREFFSLDWPDGETIHYNRSFGDTTVDSVMTVSKAEANGKPTYRLDWEDTGFDLYFEVYAADGRPVSYETIGTAPKEFKSSGTYRADEMDLLYNGNGTEIQKTIPKPAENWYEPNSMFYLIRNFPFGEVERLKAKAVYENNGSIITVQITDKGTETITVPGGTFECHKLLLEPAGVAALLPIGKFWYWIEEAAPHRLIKGDTPNYTLEYVRME